MLLYRRANENLLIKKAAKADTTQCLGSVFEIAHDVSVEGRKKPSAAGVEEWKIISQRFNKI